ncbi:hypothetical protein [Mucilaginibacter sp. OK098]|uniref:hypothetical protein n=1 Tax=Mucilaginibacter sp. OK098 TaxID=1855297 RepID=UPI00091D4A4E|nr:hypothetical protein [Mucilaginibacter sp. OK098]SHN18228.1 hypothetical protein SAMN05216524_106185 [Mucilaginibacter sp. OK098]
MPENIFVFETREVNYLKPYLDKAKSLGFNVTVTDNSYLENNKLFKEFIDVYKHYSVNPPEFEIACFARYFAIASILKNDDPFLLTDTDVYVTKAFRDLQGHNFKGTFVGSEGFYEKGSEGQISPHCTIWNRDLLIDFIDFILNTYKKNHENDFLENYYQSQKEKHAYTSVSDMNLIYLWIQANNVPYVNSNSTKFEFGIDHNLSSLLCADDEFEAFAGRKFLKVRNDKITCFLKSGKEQNMALLHFQGAYKPILQRFYLKRYAKFIHFTLRNNYIHNRKKISN